MADMAEKKVTLKRGKETLEVTAPTYAGITALETLGWEIEVGRKPGRPRPRPKAEAFDEDAAREEIAASLRAELEEQIRAEFELKQAEFEASMKESAQGDKKPPAKK